MDCKVCLKPEQFCTCVGAELKHNKKNELPLKAPVQGPPEDKIVGDPPKSVADALDEEDRTPKEEKHGIFHKKSKKKKHHEE